MTIEDFHSFLSALNPDHYPRVTTASDWEAHFYLDGETYRISIVKFPPDYDNGNWECYAPGIFDDVYRHPYLHGIFEYLLEIRPSILYSPTNHPEYFL